MAGRIMSKRAREKYLLWSSGFYRKNSIIFKKDALPDMYDEIKTYDIGDIVGVKGEIFKTKMGQISVRVSELTLLSKSLQILPENITV